MKQKQTKTNKTIPKRVRSKSVKKEIQQSPAFFSSVNYQKTLRSVRLSLELFKLRTEIKTKKILSSLNNQAQQEITYFENTKYPISFKPFLVGQGLTVFLLFFVFVSFLIPSPQLDQTLVINSSVTKQNTSTVADSGVIKWTTLVRKGDITSDNYLLTIPKSAQNIKIKTITSEQADIVLRSNPQQLSQKQKQEIAKSNQPRSYFLSSLANVISRFTLSSLEDGVQAIIESQNDQVEVIEDVKVVDLSSEAIETPTEQSTEQSAIQPTPTEETPTITEFSTPSDEPTVTLPDIAETTTTSSEPTITPANQPETQVIPPVDQVVAVEYETPAPEITERETDQGKLVTVSSDTELINSAGETVPLTDVLAFTNIPEIYKVGQESKIKIKWTNNNDQNVTFKAYDTNNNGKLDYVEWTVPHLSTQTFEIIFISKAFLLDHNKDILEDVYDTVKSQDNNWLSVTNGQYVRVTFEKALTNKNDITLVARPTNSGDPVTINAYTTDTNQLVATFFIDKQAKYQELIPDLVTSTDQFDLQILGDVDIDFIVDPVDLSTGLVAHYKMNDTDGTTVVDSISANNGFGTYTATTGRIGGGLSFNGANDFVNLGNPIVSQLQYFTTTYWVRFTGTDPIFISSHSDITNNLYSWGLRRDGTQLRVGHDYVWDGLLYDAGSYLTDGWHMVGFYRDSAADEMGIILDGVVVATTTYSATFDFGDLLLGKREDGYGQTEFDIDDVRIYNRTLSAQEISVLATGTEEEASGTTTTDGLYTVVTYKSGGTFTPPEGVSSVEALIVAGGGGGGGSTGGGGGAGGLLYSSDSSVTAGTPYTVVVGAGGAGGNYADISASVQGENSEFNSLVAFGGGRGMSLLTEGSWWSGGSGGGGDGRENIGGVGELGQGYPGGTGGYDLGGGGGGAGEVGETPTGSIGGIGGNGVSTYSDLLIVANVGEDIGGTHWIAGGGAGTYYNAEDLGDVQGGYGGGGDAPIVFESTTNGNRNGMSGTGGGGGAGGPGYELAGSGGSGVVILRYLTPVPTYPVNLGDGLVAHYKANDTNGTTLVDEAGGNTGTGTYTPNSTTQKVGTGAASFNGSEELVLPDITLNNSKTLATWVLVAGDNNETILDNSVEGHSSHFGILANNTINLNENYIGFPSTGTITPGVWNHIAITLDYDTNEITHYINGAAAGLGVISSPNLDPINYDRIGSIGIPHDWSITGKIDDLRIYNRAINSTEVTSLYNSGAGTERESGPIAHYKMNDTNGTTVIDSVSGLNGTGTYTPATAKVGTGSLDFNGTSDYTTIGTNLFSSSQFSSGTISTWVNLDNSISDNGMIFDIYGVAFVMYQSSTDKFRCGTYDGITPGEIDGIITPNKNTWYLVTLTWDGTTEKCYVNGSLENSLAITSPLIDDFKSRYVRMGAAWDESASLKLKGNVDDVRVYDRAVSAGEVKDLYNAGTGTESEENTGTITTDGNYKVVTFNGSGKFTPPAGVTEVEALIVAGGGGGASGGGGAGGLLYYGSETPKTPDGSALSITAGNSYSIAVGEGGTAGDGYAGSIQPTNGGLSSFNNNYTAVGGGAGGINFFDTESPYAGVLGGSGGGGGYSGVIETFGGDGTSDQGYAGGGNGNYRAFPYPSGGGGGAGGLGGSATSNNNFGVGGIGLAYSTTGSPVTYATGGDGVTYGYGLSGANGLANTGNGGDGAGLSVSGGNGGSGVVIIRYLTPDVTNPSISYAFGTPSDNSYQNSTSANVIATTSDNNGQHSVFTDWNNSLVGCWKLNGDATDSSGNANDGTNNGATSTTGKLGQAMSFDGVSNYINIPSNPKFTSNDFSISSWVKPNSIGSTTQMVLSRWAAWFTEKGDFHIFMLTDGTMTFNAYSNDWLWSFTADDLRTSTALIQGEWALITVTRNGNNYSMYLNGVFQQTKTSSSDISDTSNSHDFSLGVNYDQQASEYINHFNGDIDDVMIFNRALSSDEIASIYDASADQYSNTFTDLAEDSYTFKTYAQDLAGNVSSVGPRTFTVDSINPTSTISTPTTDTYSTSTTVALTGTSADTNLSSTTISVDGGAFVATGGTAGDWTYSATSLSQGAHTFQSKATDLAGSTGLSSVVTVIVDTTSPSISYAYGTPSDNSYQNSTSANVIATTSDNNGQHSVFTDWNNSLVGWWKLNGDATDSSGNNNDGTNNGATATTGKLGQAMSFNGVDQYIDVVTGVFNEYENFTISGWFYKTGNSEDDVSTIVSMENAAKVFARVDVTNDNYVGFYNYDGTFNGFVGSTLINNNQWYYFTAIRNGNNSSFYLNGEFKGSQTTTDLFVVSFDAVGFIGQRFSGDELYDYNFNGSIDDVMVFNRALSADEVASIYDASADQYSHTFTDLAEDSYTFKTYAQDLAGNVSTGGLRTFTIETVLPTVSAGTDQTKNVSFIQTTATASDADSGIGSYLWEQVSGPGTVTFTSPTSITSNMFASMNGDYVIRLTATDNANNSASDTFNLTWSFGGGSSGETTTPTTGTPETPTTPTTPEDPSILSQLGEQISNIGQQISNLFGRPEQPGLNYPPIEEAVPEEPQIVFQGGNIILLKDFEKINILPLPDSVKELVFKFPRFASTLESIGFSKPEDIEKLKVATLSFPSLSEVVGASSNISIANLTDDQRQKIPSNITFARTGADNIDFNINVSISDLNEPIQSITTIQGKPLYLTIKPDNPASGVKGYIIFKSANPKVAILHPINKFISASILEATNLSEPVDVTDESVLKKDMVLSEFDYVESNGIWMADVEAPPVNGTYEIRTVVQYKEKTKDNRFSENISMVLVVDPEGYIYEKIAGNRETRINEAKVSIYWLNPDIGKYELWPAKQFLQENPQITDVTGKYSFLVPEGDYYIEVQSKDFITYKGEVFKVEGGKGVHQNIELHLKNWWARVFTIERIMMGIIILLLLISLVLIFYRRIKIIK